MFLNEYSRFDFVSDIFKNYVGCGSWTGFVPEPSADVEKGGTQSCIVWTVDIFFILTGNRKEQKAINYHLPRKLLYKTRIFLVLP